jgi:hypothetical protein
MNENPYSASPIDSRAQTQPSVGSKIRRIKKFSPLQLGKISGIMYVIVSLIFVPFLLLAALFGSSKDGGISIVLVIFIPVIYGVMGFLTGVLGGFVYNMCAKIVGGIEVEIE